MDLIEDIYLYILLKGATTCEAVEFREHACVYI